MLCQPGYRRPCGGTQTIILMISKHSRVHQASHEKRGDQPTWMASATNRDGFTKRTRVKSGSRSTAREDFREGGSGNARSPPPPRNGNNGRKNEYFARSAVPLGAESRSISVRNGFISQFLFFPSPPIIQYREHKGHRARGVCQLIR